MRSVDVDDGETTSWGHLSWLVGEREMPGTDQTFGVVTIHSQERNPLHRHPNCEEPLYVVSGECDHLLGEELFHLTPRLHHSHAQQCAALDQVHLLVAVIFFSAADS